MVRLIDALLTEAVQHGASDIHFEPESSFLRIRYRVDGVLRQVRSLHKSFWPAMVVRMKVMSDMNIAETRAPQDGRISLRLSGRPIDFRVASHPTTHGENLVLRILDRQKGIVPLDQLGLDDAALNMLKTDHRQTGRHRAGDRPDRQRQDHHAVFGAESHQHRVGQHHDAGRPGRISASR